LLKNPYPYYHIEGKLKTKPGKTKIVLKPACIAVHAFYIKQNRCGNPFLSLQRSWQHPIGMLPRDAAILTFIRAGQAQSRRNEALYRPYAAQAEQDHPLKELQWIAIKKPVGTGQHKNTK
jgi:hypothetical protein